MKKIEARGNLPKHIQAFAVHTGGVFSTLPTTEFWEAANVDEFEKAACGKLDPDVRFEIVPTIDQSTNRHYLVGFDTEEPRHVVTLTSYVKLKMYFIELTEFEFKEWDSKIQKHREEQEQAMFERRKKQQARRAGQ